MPAYPYISFQTSTLVELLDWRASTRGDERLYTFLSDGEQEGLHLSYVELHQQARRIGSFLQRRKLGGERAILLYPAGLEYLAAFFGCLYAGVCAVPVYPPPPNRPASRLTSIIADAQPSVILTVASIASSSYKQRLLAHTPEVGAFDWIVTDDFVEDENLDWNPYLCGRGTTGAITSETLAFLQYTSGSTGSPKGVKLTHGNLMDNLSLIKYGFQLGEVGHCVSWLPLYHDMGLIGSMLGSLCYGGPCIFMSPAAFLQRPIRWLQTISRGRGSFTISGAPNIAYQLCCEKISTEQLTSLDLSSWRVAFCGAEPLRYETLVHFAQKFALCGFSSDAFCPCYGLAEATLMVAGGIGPAPPKAYPVLRSALTEGRIVEACAGEGAEAIGANSVPIAQQLVSCGKTLQHVVIVDSQTQTECLPGQIGEIWVSSKSVAQGYWNRPEETEHTFHAHLAGQDHKSFLRTGDLGFIHDSELYVTGRLKDLIIIWGRNLYPQDIELTAEQSYPGLRSGSSAAFSVNLAGVEQLVIAQEVERSHQSSNTKEIIEAIRQAVAEHYEVRVHAVVLLKPGSIPRTSSGKIQRHLCRENLLNGQFNVL